MNRDQKVYTVPGAWSGGSFELGMIYPADTSTNLIREIVQQIWSHPDVEGCYARIDHEPKIQERIDPSSPNFEPEGIARGIAILPNKTRVCCTSQVIKDDQHVWIYFGLPIGSLHTAYPIGAYPTENELPLDWTISVSNWLRNVGEQVFNRAPFKLGCIGWLAVADIELVEFETKGIPADRWWGYLTPGIGKLIWTPPNMGYPMRSD